jgi:AraC family transcriptional regulator
MESVYVPARVKIEFRFNATTHLLVMYDGARRDGETSIDGVPPSRLRYFGNKLTFVPSSRAYREWHETSTPTRMTYLYLDPVWFQTSTEADAAHAPRIFFEDPVVWETATKLYREIESGQSARKLYSEALVGVLAHDLSRPADDLPHTSSVSRGGLASWQMRAVTAYIEEHVNEKISLATLAKITHLSPHHFCRAFKESLGIPPLRYHAQRRIERAKLLLAERTTSVTDVALSLGYPHISSFTVAFRRTTGQTPSGFRRDFT